MTGPSAPFYFPAVVCAEFASPIDALTGMHIPLDEAQDLVAACGPQLTSLSLLAALDGGRWVAAIPLGGGRWAACNAFPERGGASPAEAGRRLAKIAKRGRRGLVGQLAHSPRDAAGASSVCAGLPEDPAKSR